MSDGLSRFSKCLYGAYFKAIYACSGSVYHRFRVERMPYSGQITMHQDAPVELEVIGCSAQSDATKHFALRAMIYGKHYRNIDPHQFADLYDETDDQGVRRSHLLGVYQKDKLLGTCRVLHAIQRGVFVGSEIADIFDVDWTHLANTLQRDIAQLDICELGKFAIQSSDQAKHVKARLLQAAGKYAQDLGSSTILAVMTPQVEITARRAGARFERLSCALRRDTRPIKSQLLKYADYFLPGLKRLGIDIDPNKLDDSSETALDRLLAGSEDGPALWYASPSQLASLSSLP